MDEKRKESVLKCSIRVNSDIRDIDNLRTKSSITWKKQIFND